MEDHFIPVTWPEVQELMTYDDFRDNAVLITDGKLYQTYGDSAYLVNQEWYNRISIIAMFESYLKNVNAYDRFIEMIKPSTLRKRLTMSPVGYVMLPIDYVICPFEWYDTKYWRKIHNGWIEELFIIGVISDKEANENRLN